MYKNNTRPLLTVCLITYNHYNYIAEAINSVLAQDIDFSWEIIIADDYSTDGTRDILLRYRNLYPDLIRLILQEKNVGPAKNWLDLLNFPKSKYIAYMECDDYWTDPFKLKKQIAVLENDESISLCFHDVSFINLKNNTCTPFKPTNRIHFSTRDVILMRWFCPSSSVVFRKEIVQLIPSNISAVRNGDIFLLFVATLRGSLYRINECMGAYRYLSNGSASDKTKKDQLYKNMLNTLNFINNYSNKKFEFYIYLKLLYVISGLPQGRIISYCSNIFNRRD